MHSHLNPSPSLQDLTARAARLRSQLHEVSPQDARRPQLVQDLQTTTERLRDLRDAFSTL